LYLFDAEARFSKTNTVLTIGFLFFFIFGTPSPSDRAFPLPPDVLPPGSPWQKPFPSYPPIGRRSVAVFVEVVNFFSWKYYTALVRMTCSSFKQELCLLRGAFLVNDFDRAYGSPFPDSKKTTLLEQPFLILLFFPLHRTFTPLSSVDRHHQRSRIAVSIPGCAPSLQMVI